MLKKDQAESVNEFEVNKLKNAGAVSSSFKGEFTGNKGSFGNNDLDVPEEITYYIGETVMFVQNDNSDMREQVGIKAPPGTRRFDNGTVGTVVGFSDERGLPIVEVVKMVTNPKTGEQEEEKVQIEVGRATNHKTIGKDITRIDPNTGKPTVVMEESLSATYTQIPLLPGYAITTHKTQSKSLDSAAFLLGTDKKQEKPWESGQTYVGLSRVRTLDGVFLSRKLTHEDFIVDPEIVQFYKEVEMVTTEEKTKKEQRELERERQEAAQQQPSEPVSEEPAIDEKVSGEEKIFLKKLDDNDLKSARDILEYKTKRIDGMPSDWGTYNLSDDPLLELGDDYDSIDDFEKDFNAIMTKEAKDLNIEQQLLVSLILERGKSDRYFHPESNSVINRLVLDDLNDMSSDEHVLDTIDSHAFILQTGLTINGGMMNITLRAKRDGIGEKNILGQFSPTSSKIELYTEMIENSNLSRKDENDYDPLPTSMLILEVLAHEYGHYLDAEVKNYYEERLDDEPSFASYIRDLILAGMQNRAKIVYNDHALNTQSEYVAESYALYLLRDVFLRRGYSEEALFDWQVMEKLFDAIDQKNSRRAGQKFTISENQERAKAKKAQESYNKELEVMWERLEKEDQEERDKS